MDEPWLHMTKYKKSMWKGYILFDSKYKTFLKRQKKKKNNYGDSKGSVVAKG